MSLERVLARTLTLAVVLPALGCDRGHRETPAPVPAREPAAPAARQTPATACTLEPIPTRVPLAPKRLVAIGDLHGDLAATRAALKAAGAIDEADRWIGGELVIVQTGDILDRGDDEEAILELFDRLAGEARTAGGAIVQLNGNHELMNVARDFRYVTADGMRDFGGDRKRAFDPGGPWAKRLAGRNLVAIVGDTVFSHAGVVTAWAARVDAENLASRCWLDGQAGRFDQPTAALVSMDSPVWTRAYGVPGELDCAQLDAALAALGAARMVVGHTPQREGITSDCDGKLWRIDVGLARHYGGPIEVLELGAAPKVLPGSR